MACIDVCIMATIDRSTSSHDHPRELPVLVVHQSVCLHSLYSESASIPMTSACVNDWLAVLICLLQCFVRLPHHKEAGQRGLRKISNRSVTDK